MCIFYIITKVNIILITRKRNQIVSFSCDDYIVNIRQGQCSTMGKVVDCLFPQVNVQYLSPVTVQVYMRYDKIDREQTRIY